MDGHDQSFDDTVLRAAGALCLFGVALIHFLDFFSKLAETPYLVVLSATAIAQFGHGLRIPSRRAWRAAADAVPRDVVSSQPRVH